MSKIKADDVFVVTGNRGMGDSSIIPIINYFEIGQICMISSGWLDNKTNAPLFDGWSNKLDMMRDQFVSFDNLERIGTL